MNKKDKEKIFILLFLLLYIAVFIVFCFGTSKLPFTWLIAAVIIVQYFIILPLTVSLYYRVHNAEIGFGRFIPIWNEISMFSGKTAIASLVSYALLVIMTLLLFVPTSFIDDVFGDFVMFRWHTMVIRIIVILALCNTIIVGIGYYNVQKSVNSIHHSMLSSTAKLSAWEVCLYTLYFIPIIRVVPIVYLLDRLNKIAVLNNYRVDKVSDRLEKVNE